MANNVCNYWRLPIKTNVNRNLQTDRYTYLDSKINIETVEIITKYSVL